MNSNNINDLQNFFSTLYITKTTENSKISNENFQYFPQSIQIFINHTGEIFPLTVEVFSSIEYVKFLIQNSYQMNLLQINLSFGGKVLRNETTLYDNNIGNHSTLNLFVKYT